MVNTLLVYKGEEVIKQQQENKEGKTSIVIDGLKSNTDYTKGTYKLAWSNGAKEGPKADVPAFKTKKIGVTTVTAKPSSTNIVAGKTQQITSEVTPTNADDKTLTYTSNNEPVATVNDSGLINAVKAGDATITVKSNDNTKATANVSVTVEKAVVNVTGVTLDATTATMNIDDTKQLSSTVAPANATDKTVTYASKAQGVASVDNKGLITAKSAGTAQIVATTKDGAKTATCDVTVEKAVVNVTGVGLTPATATLDIGATQQLAANVTPSEADNKKVSYTSGSDAIATVNATGLVTAIGEGTTDITVTTKDGAKKATSSITVNAAEVTDPPEEEKEE